MTANDLLSWIRSHDWGRLAYIYNSRVYGIIDATSCASRTISLPLDLAAIKLWAGY